MKKLYINLLILLALIQQAVGMHVYRGETYSRSISEIRLVEDSYFHSFFNFYRKQYCKKRMYIPSKKVFLLWANMKNHGCASIEKTEEQNPLFLQMLGNPHSIYTFCIFIDYNILKLPYGAQKIILGHEVFHCIQFEKKQAAIMTKHPHLNPKGFEQEADAKTLLNCGCYECAQEYISYQPEEDSRYLTQSEGRKLLKKMPYQLCPYHQGRAEGIPHDVLIKEIEEGTREI